MRVSAFIEPCLPSPTDQPPRGAGWIHEIKHDGFRLMVRRDPAGLRLITRNGHDWSGRFPLIAQAADALKVRSFLIDGEAVACDGDGMPSFDRLRYRRADGHVFLFAFDLIELNGKDLRREPLVRKATLASVLRVCGSMSILSMTAKLFFATPASSGLRASSRSGSARLIARADRGIGSK
jgi:bifunctional non-homologous end joining protein LigD